MLTEDQKQFVEMVRQRLATHQETEVDPSIADMDELQLWVSVDPSLFPDLVVKLITSPVTSQEGRRMVVERALRVFSASRAIPESIRLQAQMTQGFDVESLNPFFVVGQKESERMLELCIQMRKIVWGTEEFDQPHRLRLLNRISAIEAEVHKPKGFFDVVRGGINDLGETLGKFGIDIKPLTDRMQEVVGIARKGSKDYDQLPAPDEVKRLPPPDEKLNSKVED